MMADSECGPYHQAPAYRAQQFLLLFLQKQAKFYFKANLLEFVSDVSLFLIVYFLC